MCTALAAIFSAAFSRTVRVGADADITVFDPDRVIDRATYDEPLQYSEGIQFVFIDGVAVVRDDQLVDGVFPGRAARAPIQLRDLQK